MKTRRTFSLLLVCCMLMALLLPAGAVGSPEVDCGVDGSLTSEQVYIKPVQIDENTYYYYDKSGELLAIYTDNTIESYSASAKETRYTIGWDIRAGHIKQSSVSLDTTLAASEVHYTLFFTTGVPTYVGYYHPGADKYTWFDPPHTKGGSGYFLCATSHPINFALKNDGVFDTTYSGQFYLKYA